MEEARHHQGNGTIAYQQQQQNNIQVSHAGPNEDAYRRSTTDDDKKTFVRDNVYQMVAEPRGQVLIINNANHAEAQSGNSGGSYREDGERLMTTFKSLGFAVYKRDQFYDLSRRRMEKLLRKFANSKLHKYADACVVVFLTHGNFRDGVYAADGWKIAFEDIVKLFGESEVLYRKPKVFIFDGMHGGGYPDRGVSPPSQDENSSENVREHEYGDSTRHRADTGVHSPAALNNNDGRLQSSPSLASRNPNNNDRNEDAHYITHSRGAHHDSADVRPPLAAGADMVFIYNCMHPYRAVHTQDARFIHVLCDTIDENASKHDLLAILTVVNRRLGSQPSAYMNEFQQSCFTSSLHKLLYFNRGYFENTPLLSDDSDISIGGASHSMSPRLSRRDPFGVVSSTTTSSLSSATQQPHAPSRPKKQQQQASLDREVYATAPPSHDITANAVQGERLTEEFVETDEGRKSQRSPQVAITTTTTTKETVVEEVAYQTHRPPTPGATAATNQQVVTTWSDSGKIARPLSGLRGKLKSRQARSVNSVATSSSRSSSSASSTESGGDRRTETRKSGGSGKDVAGRTKSLGVTLEDEKVRGSQFDTADTPRHQQAHQTVSTTPGSTTKNIQTTATTSTSGVRQRRFSDDGGRAASSPLSSTTNSQKKKKRSFMSKLRRLLRGDKKEKGNVPGQASASTSATLPAPRSPTTATAVSSTSKQTATLPIKSTGGADDDYPHWIHSSPQPARRSNVEHDSAEQPQQAAPPQRHIEQEGTTYEEKNRPEYDAAVREQEEQPFRHVVLDHQQKSNVVASYPAAVNENDDDVFTSSRKQHNSGLYSEPQQADVEQHHVSTVTTKLPENDHQTFVAPNKSGESFEDKNNKFVLNSSKGNVTGNDRKVNVEYTNDELRTSQFSPDVEVAEQKIYDEKSERSSDAPRGISRRSSGDSGRRTPLDQQYTQRKETFPLPSPALGKSSTPSTLSPSNQFFAPDSQQQHYTTVTTYEEAPVVQEGNQDLYAPSTPGQQTEVQKSISSSVSSSTNSPASSPRGQKPPVPAKPGLLDKLKENLGMSAVGTHSGNRSPTTPTSSPAFNESTNSNFVIVSPDQSLYNAKDVELEGERPIATASRRPSSPPPAPPALWFGHDPAHRSPDTSDVRTQEIITEATEATILPPAQQRIIAVATRASENEEAFVQESDGLYTATPDENLQPQASLLRDNVETERSISTSSSPTAAKKSRSPISWLSGTKKLNENDDVQIRTITAAEVPVLQSSSNNNSFRGNSNETYSSESVEGRATPTGYVAYGSAVARRRHSNSSSSNSGDDEKSTKKTSEKIKEFFRGPTPTKDISDKPLESRSDSVPHIRPVLEPVLSNNTERTNEVTVFSTQLTPLEKQRQEQEDYDRVVLGTERQISSPLAIADGRPHIEPVMFTSQQRSPVNAENTAFIAPSDEQLYRIKDVEVTDEVPRSSVSPTRQFSGTVNRLQHDEQQMQSPRTPTNSGAVSKLKEAFFGTGRSSPTQPSSSVANENNEFVSERQQKFSPVSSPHYVTTTTTHTSSSTVVVPVSGDNDKNSGALPTGEAASFHEINQQPIGWKASVLPQYPPDYSYSSTRSQQQQQQQDYESDEEVDTDRHQASKVSTHRPESKTVEVLRETTVTETVPNEFRPPRAASRTSEYVTPRSSAHEDEHESFETPQTYRITSSRNIDSDDDGGNQVARESYSPRTPTNVAATTAATATRWYDTVDDERRANTVTFATNNNRGQPAEFESDSEEHAAAYAAHLRHIEREEKIKREEEDFPGRRSVPELVNRFESFASTNTMAATEQYYPQRRSQTSSPITPTQQQQQRVQREDDRESDASLSPDGRRRRNILVERSESAIVQQKRRGDEPPNPTYLVEEEDKEAYAARGRDDFDYDTESRQRDGRKL